MTQPVIDTSLVYTRSKRFQLNSYRRTRAKIERMIEEHPQKQKQYYFELARLEALQKNWDQAQQAIGSVLRIDPEDGDALLFSAQVSELQGKYEEAQRVYQDVIDSHPYLSMAYREYGRFLLGQKQSLPAIQSLLLRGLELEPKDALAHIILARLYLQQDRINQAVLHIEIARGVHNGNSLVYQEVAQLYMILGKYEEAIRHWKLATQVDPKNKALKIHMKQMIKEIQKQKKGKSG